MLAMVATGATGAGWMAAVTAVLLALRAAPVRARPFALALTALAAVLVLASARPPGSMSAAAAAQPSAPAAMLCTLLRADGALAAVSDPRRRHRRLRLASGRAAPAVP